MLAPDASGTPLATAGEPYTNSGSSAGIRSGATSEVCRKNYFLHRLESLGLSPAQARDHGLGVADDGTILQFVRNFQGGERTFVPEHRKKQYLKVQNRRTATEIPDSHWQERLAVRRLHPEALAADPSLNKYMNEQGVRVYPLPTNLAIANYTGGVQGGTIALIEGYFKALALSLRGVEASAFTGISVYKLCEDLREYVTARRPDRILIMYDADALDLSKGDLLTSRRQEDFMNSATRFAKELFTLFQVIDLKCAVTFVMGRRDLDEKGVDDLMVKHGAHEVVEDLQAFKVQPRFATTEFFEGFSLSQSTYVERLHRLFLGNHYREWAERHLDEVVGDKDLTQGFRYGRARYKISSTGSLLDGTNTYRLESDPFAVKLRSAELTVQTYLTEQKQSIDNLIDAHDRLAIQAPTGAGKTFFFCDYSKRKNVPLVLTVPTVSLAKQIAKDYGGYALHGNYDPHKVQAAHDARVVVCTYDTLPHVADLWRRLLVVDEAHNLVNQYGESYRARQQFRAHALRRCLNLVRNHRASGGKSVLISGTMPAVLCRALDCHFVRVHRLQNPRVRVFDIEAEKSTNGALAKCLLTRMREIKWTTAQTHVVFWNNTEEIEKLKDTLVEMDLLTADQIAIISRRHYNQGETESLDHIIRNQRIKPNIKLVLCTCLISEGINIKNTNIGRVFIVNLRCPDTFRQFIARFRKLDVVNVFSILPPERDLRPDFFRSAQLELDDHRETAELQVKQITRREEYYRQEYAEDELPFLDDIESAYGYEYAPQLMDLTYRDQGVWQVDILQALARIRGRMLATANNCYLYTRLAEAGFEVLRIAVIEVADEVREAVDVQLETTKELQKVFRRSLKEQLAADSHLLLNALYLYYKEKGNRHGTAQLHKLVPDLLNDQSIPAAAWLHKHRPRFDKASRARVIRLAKLIYLGVPPEDRPDFLAMPDNDWNRHYKAAVFYFESQLMSSRAGRKQMRAEHKEDVRLKVAIANLVGTHAEEHLSPVELARIVRPLVSASVQVKKDTVITRFRKGKEVQEILRKGSWKKVDVLAFSPAQLVRLVQDITNSQVIGSGRDRTVQIGETWSALNVPLLAGVALHLERDPLKVLCLSDG